LLGERHFRFARRRERTGSGAFAALGPGKGLIVILFFGGRGQRGKGVFVSRPRFDCRYGRVSLHVGQRSRPFTLGAGPSTYVKIIKFSDFKTCCPKLYNLLPVSIRAEAEHIFSRFETALKTLVRQRKLYTFEEYSDYMKNL